jgi:chromosome transmission fidelity protein 1
MDKLVYSRALPVPYGLASLISPCLSTYLLTLSKGKSLSLICAALTWLRNHKKKVYEISINTAAQSFKDEPDWVVDQLLKRKRAEIADLWEEREQNFKNIRAKEAIMEERGRKRRRFEDGDTSNRGKRSIADEDDDEEWLLDDTDEQDVPRSHATGNEEDDEIDDGDRVKVG